MNVHPFRAALAAVCLAALTAGPAVAREEHPAGPRARELEPRGAIVIESNDQFDAEHGVRRGNGTPSNPYVISGWEMPSLVIRDTSAWVTIKDNVITGTVVLNWTGDGLRLVHNSIGDLRVNQNVERKGDATDGLIAANTFGVVGQLRHFDGVFTRNVVGSKDLLFEHPRRQAVNLDGFNGARFTHNTIYGSVDATLHGHHHSSGFGGNSHDHDTVREEGMGYHHGHRVDHSERYHELAIIGNVIYSADTWALRYNDRAHQANDRTAASEPNKLLNCPHVHHTRVHLNDNELIGAGLWVDVFNADDDNHWNTERGFVEVRGNSITLDRDFGDVLGGRYGIVVQQAVDVTLRVTGNRIHGADALGEEDLLGLESRLNKAAGIRLDRIADADLYIERNEVAHRTYGVHASNFPKSVRWWVNSLTVGDVERAVFYENVKNPPRGTP